MNKEEYKPHLCDVIFMVFQAEDTLHKENTDLAEKLKSRLISPEQYVGMIADEILAHTTEELIPND